MLDIDHARQLSESHWKLLAAQTHLPRAVAEYFAAKPAEATRLDSRRQFHRKPLRGIAILLTDDQRHAAVTKDLSRAGIGFFAPIHLFPKKIVELWLPSSRILRLRVTRCFRIGPDCFMCGSTFELNGQ
jgi:hypothetical protein